MSRPILIGALICALVAGVGLLVSDHGLLGYAGSEVYGHAWVQWWHGQALPAWPGGTSLARGADPWPVIDPLPTALGALVGRLLGYRLAWNGLAMGAVALAFVGGAVLARSQNGHPLVGGVVLALGPIFGGSLASGLTEDWALGLVALALAGVLHPRLRVNLVGGVALGLVAWCGLYLALIGAAIALFVGAWRLVEERAPGVLAAAALALVIALPAALLQGERLSGEGHRSGGPPAQMEEPLWKVNPWRGADLASFVAPGAPDLSDGPMVRLHPIYLGLLPLLLGLAGGRSRWWLVLAGAVVLAPGPELRALGRPLGVANPVVAALDGLPLLELVNHYGRLFLGGQIALAVLAARGAQRLTGRGPITAALAVGLELILVAPAPWPLPVAPGSVDAIWHQVDAGTVLVLPAGGPGVHFQRPLYEQRAHGQALATRPNQGGLPPGVMKTELGPWLGGLAFDRAAPPPPEPDLEPLRRLGIGAVVVRSPYDAQVEAVLGPPDARADGGALWRLSSAGGSR